MLTEPIEKDSPCRAAYAEGVAAFIRSAQTEAAARRALFSSPARYLERQAEYREKFRALLGFPLTEYPDLEGEAVPAERTYVGSDEGIRYERVTLKAYRGIPLYGILLTPEKYVGKKKRPFLLCQHGGGGTPELITGMHMGSANYNHMALRFAKKGFTVFCPQLYLWNTDNYGLPYDLHRLDGSLRQLGGSMTGLEVLLLRRALDHFAALPEIDADRMFDAGLSYGGMYALYLAAADERVKGCYSSCWFNDRYANAWVDWCYKNSANEMLDAEIAALVAPRKLFISVGKNDPTFHADAAEREFRRLEPFYAAFGAAENLRFEAFDGEHECSRTDEGFDFLASAAGPER